VIACAKGIERGTHKFMTEVIAETAPRCAPGYSVGTGFLPTTSRAAFLRRSRWRRPMRRSQSPWCRRWASSTFRPYHTTDVRGVEIGGAAKNVLAIAAGIVVGRKFGASAQAALTTRGFSELVRLGRACGARSETMSGLSGLGDLILTCSSPQSRNFALGIALGRGERPPQDKLAEGEFTAPVLVELGGFAGCRHAGIKCGRGILSGATTIDEAIESLLTRPFKAEG